MLQRIIIFCLALSLFACKGELDTLDQISKLEKEIEASPDIEKANQLIQLYKNYIGENPEDAETNSKFLYRSAGVQYRQNKFNAAAEDLKTAVHDYSSAANTPNALLLLSKIMEENFKDKNLADLYKSAFVNKYPSHEKNTEVKALLNQQGISMDSIIAQTETAFYTPKEGKAQVAMDRNMALKLVNMYDIYTSFNQDSPKTAEYLYKGAEIARSNSRHEKALSFYQKLYTNHPDYAKAPQALFLMGFTYENDFNDLNKARTYYEEFLQKFPEHELAKSVKFSLDNLGKPAEEIIKDFEAKKKAQENVQ